MIQFYSSSSSIIVKVSNDKEHTNICQNNRLKLIATCGNGVLIDFLMKLSEKNTIPNVPATPQFMHLMSSLSHVVYKICYD